MSDIVVNVNEQKLKELLEIYKNNFWGIHWEQEKFKWEGVAEFQSKWDINVEDFSLMFFDATEKVSPSQGGLFDSKSVFPRGNIQKMYDSNPQGTRQLFIDLFNENVDFEIRAKNFLDDAEKIWRSCDGSEGHKDDQLNYFTTYLWLMYPDKYHIYRYFVCRAFALAIDSSYVPYKGSNDNKTFDSIIDSQKFYNKICSLIKDDDEIKTILKKCDDEIKFEKPDGEFAKKDYTKWLNTLVTDFAFFIKIRLEDMEDKKKNFKEWALKKGNAIGIKDATVNGYISALERMWKKSNVADKMELPYAYGSEDIDELKGLYSDFDKNGDMADSDSKTGFKWYLEFLHGSEVVISYDENNDGKSKGMNNKYPKNLILYGPPGTGKTYNTVLKAMNIIAPEKNYCDSNYNDAKTEYDKLTEEGRIQFVTFHQSYGYEDFIEGIKAKTIEGQVEYEVKDGVFKAFCKKASTLIIDEKKDFGLNPYAAVWKVSLEGTGDNATRRECLDNGHIRIGFDSYGADITDETVFDPSVGGKVVLNSFINKMQVGDIVLSCYSSKTIDAIGVVTGEYEWHSEYDKYKRLRKVNWIVKDIREDITVLNNNTTLTLASVYKLNISVNDIINLVNKYDSPIKVTKNELPYVFIIDEINRGNISKIFGELITLIEETKREGKPEETSAILPYSGDSFTVPSNVYIIGTMNTADRSLAVVDTALRRRFTFEEMIPNPNLLYKEVDGKEIDIVIDGINIKELLTVMNERITALYDREHTIGHAYFMGLKDIEKPTINDLGEIFKFKIIPLLQEYFYEDYEKIRLVLGDNQKENDGSLKDDKTNNHEFIKIVEKSTDTLFGDANVLNGEAVRFYEINVNNDYNVFNDTLAYKKLQK